MINKRNDAKLERIQQRRDASTLVKRFPGVAEIVINMTYNQKGIRPILRTFNFSPNSYAFFRIDCLSKECIDGGFDLTRVITTMIRNHSAVEKGALNCEGNDPSGDYSDIVYEVTIQYVKS